ncbi:MAG: tRNA U-34 5-methylaminomethyl-2-thiouridine biosynthesis protein [Desulfurellaceae bacterium]|nr:tRNA U-34 5-methylaminomethyl-2-thiouridine biosynthesis protein [Desulfurellaceae bacterium]
MAVVSAFLVPGSPLPYVKRDNPPWGKIATGLERAGTALVQSKPDVILLYSTQWIAVLDQLWQTRSRVSGLHVDENWHEYGELPYVLKIDTQLAKACVSATGTIGVKSKAVNYDGFPIDTGTIVAANFLNPGGKIPMVLASNNLYHDFALTEKLGRLAARLAGKQKKRVAVVGVGNFSGAFFRHEIDIAKDKLVAPKYDRWNKKILALLQAGDRRGLSAALPEFATKGQADMGFKHGAWVLGALGGKFTGAQVHAYGPLYGSGGAVVEFRLK